MVKIILAKKPKKAAYMTDMLNDMGFKKKTIKEKKEDQCRSHNFMRIIVDEPDEIV